jgi:hypothetical protein
VFVYNLQPDNKLLEPPGVEILTTRHHWSAHGSIRIVPLIASPTTTLALNK